MKTKILIIGASGMLGHVLYSKLAEYPEFDVCATVRSRACTLSCFPQDLHKDLIDGVDVLSIDTIRSACVGTSPDVIINAAGIIRQRKESHDIEKSIETNALFPHRLAEIAIKINARVIQISTDCVFDGKAGSYDEQSVPTPYDIYGMTKYLGELKDAPHVTLRTSIIGPELRGNLSLVEWFLSQEASVNGYANVIYSGLPTYELSRVIAEHVITRPQLTGLYHVAATPINKFELLRLIARAYDKKIKINKFDDIVSDKSLSAERFYGATGYRPPKWPELIEDMHTQHKTYMARLQ